MEFITMKYETSIYSLFEVWKHHNINVTAHCVLLARAEQLHAFQECGQKTENYGSDVHSYIFRTPLQAPDSNTKYNWRYILLQHIMRM